MKSFLVVFAIALLAVGGGAVGAFFMSDVAPKPVHEEVVTAAEAVTPTARAAPADDDALRAQVDALSAQVARLEEEIDRLREGKVRTLAIAEPQTAAVAGAPKPQRDAILQVIEEDRQERQRKQQEERDQREMDQLLARSERIAKEVGLDARQQKALTDVLVLERQKTEEMRAQFRGDDGGAPRDFEQVREQFQTLRAWRTQELTTRFGADIAERIEKQEDARWRSAQRGMRGGRRTDAPSTTPDGG